MKVVRSALRTGLLYPHPPTPRRYSLYSFLLEADIVRTEGLSRKSHMTSSGVEPATFRLAAHYLNQLRYYKVPSKALGFILGLLYNLLVYSIR